MDNILKLLLGVLGVAGLIAMVTPTNLVTEPEPALAAEAVAAPMLAENSGEIPPEEALSGEDAPDLDGDDFVIGEPTIDGNPIGVVNDPQQQAQQQSEIPVAYPNYSFNGGQPQTQNYAPQANYGSPPPGSFVPVDNGQ